MFLTDFIEKVARVSKALTTKSPAYGHDYRYESAHHPDRYRGQHRIDYETCIGCDACNKICPVHAITMKHLPFKKRNIVPEVNLSVCIFCGLCEDVCPTKPEKSIKLSGGRYDMLTGGWHEDQDDFWVHVNIPEEYIKSRLEEEEAARVAKEMKQKKMEAEKRKAAAAKPSASNEELGIRNEEPKGKPVASQEKEIGGSDEPSAEAEKTSSVEDPLTTNDKRQKTNKKESENE